MNTKRRILTAVATVAIFANGLAPLAFAGTTITISGNAADSDNDVVVNNTQNTSVNQTNDAHFDNDIDGDANTGGNDANQNNGGDVNVQTGDASVTVGVSNWANANSARIGSNGDGSSLSLKILNNAADSDNDILVDLNSTTDVDQDNWADFDNDIDGDAKTGGNDANQNNGGNVLIDTGDASVDVNVDNMANFNWADLNCGCLFGEGGLEVLVEGNAYNSDNNVNGDFDSDQDADQDNDAWFDNDVKNSDAETGDNYANQNNSGGNGDPSVETGDADVDVDVSNEANLNGIGGDEPEWPEWNWGGLSISLSFDLGDLLAALNL